MGELTADLQEYQKFLESKQITNKASGFEISLDDLPKRMFQFQKYLTKWAIYKGKCGMFCSTGLGKTSLELSFSQFINQHTNEPVLILTPLAVANQHIQEGIKLEIEAVKVAKQSDIINGINITNYEKLHHFDPNKFSGIILDEASILKHFSSKTRNQIIEYFPCTPYKMAATATPSPNDWEELGNYAEFLGVMSRLEMLAMFFVHDGGDTSKWRLKKHAEQEFWKWVSSWAAFVRHPRDIGMDQEGYDLPELELHEHVIEVESKNTLFAMEATDLAERREARKESLLPRCELAAKVINESKDIWLVSCDLNNEGDLLEKLIPGSIQIAGKDTEEFKEKTILDFAQGKIRVLISKASIIGFGLNLQVCHEVAFVGLSDCYDSETEILTENGWKTFQTLLENEQVATINPSNNYFEWEYPEKIINQDYEGEMIEFKGRTTDLLVTPNHRMYVRRSPIRYRENTEWETKYASELANNFKRQNAQLLSVAEGWNGNYPEYIEIPKSELLDYRRTRTHTIGKVDSKKFAKFIGWYLSEGCIITYHGEITGKITISQNTDRIVYRQDIIDALSIFNLPINTTTKDMYIISRELALFIAEEFGYRSQRLKIPKWVKNWHTDLLRLLWESLMAGDGMHHIGIQEDGKHKAKTLRGLKTTSNQLIDDVQEIALKLGISTTAKYSQHTLSIRNDYRTPYIFHKPNQIQYKGKIGCVKTKNGLVIVRRNGQPMVSGNSWEQFHQFLKRVHRFGQLHKVNCHIFTSSAEGATVINIKRKEENYIKMGDEITKYTKDFVSQELTHTVNQKNEYKTNTVENHNYKLMLGDSCERIKELKDQSVDYSIYSPPFSSLYVYSNSERDMGNSKSYEEFTQHFNFLAKELFRVIKDGRLMSVHCMNLPTTKQHSGYIGIQDFRGDLIRLFQSVGFIYHSEVCIWKDPVTAMQRTKALGLLYKQLRKDSVMSRQGIPDYLLTFRKPGENKEPVTKTHESFPVDKWQNYASPVWFDINPSNTLQKESAREAKDERHIAPLQLQVIERAIELWSNPNDVVFSPFGGIGSEPFQALKMKRKAIAIELKESYYRQMVLNCQRAEIEANSGTLFDGLSDSDCEIFGEVEQLESEQIDIGQLETEYSEILENESCLDNQSDNTQSDIDSNSYLSQWNKTSTDEEVKTIFENRRATEVKPKVTRKKKAVEDAKTASASLFDEVVMDELPY